MFEIWQTSICRPSLPPSLRTEATHGRSGFVWNFFQFRRIPDASFDQSPADIRIRSTKLARLESVLFVADEPMSLRRLAQLATLADVMEAEQLVNQLNAAYDSSGSSFRVERVATGLRLLTRREFVFWLDKLHQRQSSLKLTPPMLESLAIVAYRQPLTRAEVEVVRGVQSTEMLKQLMERDLIRIAGEDDSLGRPFLYETTQRFLELYGLHSLNDLPLSDRLRRHESNADQAVEMPADAA